VYVALVHPSLDRQRAGDGLDDTREFDQEAVAGGLDDAAFVLGDLGVDQLAAVGAEPSERARLVLPHQPAVARDIGGENDREPPFDPLSAQNLLPVGGLNSQSAPRTAEEQPDAGAPRG